MLRHKPSIIYLLAEAEASKGTGQAAEVNKTFASAVSVRERAIINHCFKCLAELGQLDIFKL